MNIFKSVVEKENFGKWIMVSTALVIILYVVTVALVRVFYLKFNKKWEKLSPEEAAKTWVFQPEIIIQRILEVIIADTCILGACFTYNLFTQRFVILADYNGIVLLVLITIAVLLNNFIDNKLGQEVVCEEIERDLKKHKVIASLRLLSSFAVLIMLGVFSACFKTGEYYQLIICIIGLVLGRFIFFDTTWQAFKETVGDILKYSIYMIIALGFTMAVLGLGVYYNIIDTGNFLLSIFGGHIFILLIIKVLKNTLGDIFR